MRISVGSDHAGFELKENLKKYLQERNIDVKDFGTHSLESADFADFAHPLAKHIQKTQEKGILICGSGIGVSIAANRHKGIRAALVRNKEEAQLTREHNDANILALGGRFTSFEDAKQIVDTFISIEFEYGRHEERIKKIEEE